MEWFCSEEEMESNSLAEQTTHITNVLKDPYWQPPFVTQLLHLDFSSSNILVSTGLDATHAQLDSETNPETQTLALAHSRLTSLNMDLSSPSALIILLNSPMT